MKIAFAVVFLCSAGAAFGAFPAQTNAFIDSLTTCSDNAQSDIDCITELKDVLEQASDYIQKVRDLKNVMAAVTRGLNTLGTVTKFAKYAPAIGSVVNGVDRLLSATRTPLNNAYNRVKAIDSKIWPYKARCDNGAEKCDRAINLLESIKKKCDDGRVVVVAARDCVATMPSGDVSQGAKNGLEALGSTLTPQFNELIRTMGVLGNGCDAMSGFVNKVLRWPDMSGVLNGMNAFRNALDPILDFFEAIQSALDEEICLPIDFGAIGNAVEDAANEVGNAAEDAVDAVGNAAEDTVDAVGNAAEDVGNKVKDVIGGIFGKRSLALVKRRTCFSIQDVLDGISSAVNLILGPAQDLLDELISKIPLPDFPGLPNLGNIFNFDLNINMPTLNLDFDINFFNPFLRITWDCAINVQNVCRAGTGALSFNCGQGLTAYTGVSSITPGSGVVSGSASSTTQDLTLGYVGCFIDRPSRALTGVFVSFGNQATVEKCRSYCFDRGYRYAGVQYSHQCFCGNDDPYRYGAAPESECRAKCRGNTEQTCGGTWRNSIYTAGYLGCYEDKPSRDLGVFWNMGNGATTQMCIDRCRDTGYRYAGLQYYSQCFCGNSYGKYGTKPASNCRAPCRGNNSEMCGGTWRNSIYAV